MNLPNRNALWIIPSAVYLLVATTLTPVYAEVLMLDIFRFFAGGWRPFTDFEWYYGVLPFAVYGWPMRLLGDSLVVHRLISIIVALIILWQINQFLLEQKATRNRWIVLALATLVLTPQQHSHSHTLVTLAALMGGRLIALDGAWDVKRQLMALLACVLAVTAKPAFGAVVAVVIPLAAFGLRRMNALRTLRLSVAALVLSMAAGLLIVGNFWWMSDWYSLTQERSREMNSAFEGMLIGMRMDYCVFFFQHGMSLKSLHTFVSYAFPLLVYDVLLLAGAMGVATRRFTRPVIVFWVMTVGVSAQAILSGEMSLLGYAQEVLPLMLVIGGIAGSRLPDGWLEKTIRGFLGIALVAFGLHYLSILAREVRLPMGSGRMAAIHLRAEEQQWCRAGESLKGNPSVMTLGSLPLVFLTYQQGILDYGALGTTVFVDANCFRMAASDRAIFHLLRVRRPSLLLVAKESLGDAPASRSLAWIRARYEPVRDADEWPVKTRIFALRKGRR